MRLVLLAAAALVSTPVIAATPPDGRAAEALTHSLPAPQAVEAYGNAADTAADALMEVPVGPMEEAVTPWRDYPPEHRNETLGDMAHARDPQFQHKIHRYVGKMTDTMNAMTQTAAMAAPVVDRELDLLKQHYKRLKRELQRYYRN
jgi:hypothetical protein